MKNKVYSVLVVLSPGCVATVFLKKSANKKSAFKPHVYLFNVLDHHEYIEAGKFAAELAEFLGVQVELQENRV